MVILHVSTTCLEPACNKVEKVKFGRLTEIRLESIATVTAYKDDQEKYLKPVSKIFESVDSIIPPITGLQMTVSRSHPLKVKMLQNIVEALGCTKQNHSRYILLFQEKNFKSIKNKGMLTILHDGRNLTQTELNSGYYAWI